VEQRRLKVSLNEMTVRIHSALIQAGASDGTDTPGFVLIPVAHSIGEPNWQLQRILDLKGWYTASRGRILREAIRTLQKVFDVDWDQSRFGSIRLSSNSSQSLPEDPSTVARLLSVKPPPTPSSEQG
jgi:hypothetical protein